MDKFKYDLQSLLNLKKQMQDKAKNELADHLQILYREQQKLQNMIDIKEDSCLRMIDEKAKGLNAYRLIMYDKHLDAMNNKINSQYKNVDNAARDVERYREKLMLVSKEKEMLQKLKDKRFEEYRIEELKAEEKRIEEIISYKEKLKISCAI